MGPTIDLRIKTPDARISMLSLKSRQLNIAHQMSNVIRVAQKVYGINLGFFEYYCKRV